MLFRRLFIFCIFEKRRRRRLSLKKRMSMRNQGIVWGTIILLRTKQPYLTMHVKGDVGFRKMYHFHLSHLKHKYKFTIHLSFKISLQPNHSKFVFKRAINSTTILKTTPLPERTCRTEPQCLIHRKLPVARQEDVFSWNCTRSPKDVKISSNKWYDDGIRGLGFTERLKTIFKRLGYSKESRKLFSVMIS